MKTTKPTSPESTTTYDFILPEPNIDLSKLTFDADTHTYTYDGRKLDNVTYIMRFLNQGLERVDPNVLAQAADRGTRVHEATLVYDMEGHIDCDPDIEGYVRAYAQFLRDYRIKGWELYEKAVTDGKVAGTLDRFGYVNGMTTLLDIKSGQFRKPNHYVQLAAYEHLLHECYGVLPIQHMILSLKANGKYTVHEPTAHERNTAAMIWYSCVTLNNHINDFKGEAKNGK